MILSVSYLVLTFKVKVRSTLDIFEPIAAIFWKDSFSYMTSSLLSWSKLLYNQNTTKNTIGLKLSSINTGGKLSVKNSPQHSTVLF